MLDRLDRTTADGREGPHKAAVRCIAVPLLDHSETAEQLRKNYVPPALRGARASLMPSMKMVVRDVENVGLI